MKSPTLVIRREVLKSWLALSNRTNAEFAREMGVSRSRITQLLGAVTEPSAHLMAKLLVVTGLPFNQLFHLSWGDAAKGPRDGGLNRVGRYVSSGNGHTLE